MTGLTAASTADAGGIHQKILGSGTATLVISNEQFRGIMKIVNSIEDSRLLQKGITTTIENEGKE